MTRRASRLRDDVERTADGLPVPQTNRALLFGGVAAVIVATIWGFVTYYSRAESAWLALAVGAAVGFAVVRGGGHGERLALAAAGLAALAIGTGVHLGYQLAIEDAAMAEVDSWSTAVFDDLKGDAVDWQALGATPSDEQVMTFAQSHDYLVPDAATFRAEYEERLVWLAAAQPTWVKWREYERDRMVPKLQAELSFFGYLTLGTRWVSGLFMVLGLAAAYGFVARHTWELTAAVQDSERRKAIAAKRAADYEARRSRDASDTGS